MKLYVVRHGQTEANVNHLFNGRNERDLTEFGIEQANSLANRMKTISIDLSAFILTIRHNILLYLK